MFIRRKLPHLCVPPMMIVDTNSIALDGEVTDVWMCDECLRLWQCRQSHAFPGRMWGRASWFNKIRYRRYRKPDAGLEVFQEEPIVQLAQ